MTNTIVTTIDGVGSVEATRDLACFTLSVRVKNEDLDQAKSQANEKTTQIMKSLDGLKDKMKLIGEVSTNSLNYKLEHREGGERITAGFQVVTTISFTITVDDNLNDIYKTCLKFDSQMPRPMFSIANTEPHLEKALQNAADNAQGKLKKECALLGVSTHDLKINNWNFGYEGDLPALNFSSTTKSVHAGGGAYAAASNYSASTLNLVGERDSLNIQSRAMSKLGTIHQELLDSKLEPGTETFTIAVRVNYVWDKN